MVTGTQADGTPSKVNVITDASTGAVIEKYEGIETATGTGNGVRVGSVPLTTTLSGTTYSLKDASRGGIYTTDLNNKATSSTGTTFTDTDNAWGTGSTSSRQSAGVDAQFGAAPPGTTTSTPSAAAASRTTVSARCRAPTTAAATSTPSGTTAASA